MPVVAEFHRHPVRASGVRDPPPGEVALLVGEGEGDDVGAAPGGAQSQFAPAGADLQQPGARADPAQVQEPVDLAVLRGGQPLPVTGEPVEDRGGIAHGVVEEGREQAVGQVVVAVDVLPGAGQGERLLIAAGDPVEQGFQGAGLGRRGRGSPRAATCMNTSGGRHGHPWFGAGRSVDRSGTEGSAADASGELRGRRAGPTGGPPHGALPARGTATRAGRAADGLAPAPRAACGEECSIGLPVAAREDLKLCHWPN